MWGKLALPLPGCTCSVVNQRTSAFRAAQLAFILSCKTCLSSVWIFCSPSNDFFFLKQRNLSDSLGNRQYTAAELKNRKPMQATHSANNWWGKTNWLHKCPSHTSHYIVVLPPSYMLLTCCKISAIAAYNRNIPVAC